MEHHGVPSSANAEYNGQHAAIRLVVNADDYGYFRCVNAGIHAGIEAGVIKAAGLLTTAPAFQDLSCLLHGVPEIDYGVHLCLSSGQPLTDVMKQQLRRWNGYFPSKWRMIAAILKKEISLAIIKNEWIAQIERAISVSQAIWFLNTHEHLQVIPPLRDVLLELTDRYSVALVRDLDPELRFALSPTAWSKSLAISALRRITRHTDTDGSISCIGFGRSGQLDATYLRRRFATLLPGRNYELMCHPGYMDIDEIQDRRLIAYHRWEHELEFLLSPEFQTLCREFNIVLSRFRDLPVATKTISRS